MVTLCISLFPSVFTQHMRPLNPLLCRWRLNEILPLTKEDFMLGDPATGAPLASPFVVLRTSALSADAAAGGARHEGVNPLTHRGRCR
jgi:hypothetical protein